MDQNVVVDIYELNVAETLFESNLAAIEESRRIFGVDPNVLTLFKQIEDLKREKASGALQDNDNIPSVSEINSYLNQGRYKWVDYTFKQVTQTAEAFVEQLENSVFIETFYEQSAHIQIDVANRFLSVLLASEQGRAYLNRSFLFNLDETTIPPLFSFGHMEASIKLLEESIPTEKFPEIAIKLIEIWSELQPRAILVREVNTEHLCFVSGRFLKTFFQSVEGLDDIDLPDSFGAWQGTAQMRLVNFSTGYASSITVSELVIKNELKNKLKNLGNSAQALFLGFQLVGNVIQAIEDPSFRNNNTLLKNSIELSTAIYEVFRKSKIDSNYLLGAKLVTDKVLAPIEVVVALQDTSNAILDGNNKAALLGFVSVAGGITSLSIALAGASILVSGPVGIAFALVTIGIFIFVDSDEKNKIELFLQYCLYGNQRANLGFDYPPTDLRFQWKTSSGGTNFKREVSTLRSLLRPLNVTSELTKVDETEHHKLILTLQDPVIPLSDFVVKLRFFNELHQEATDASEEFGERPSNPPGYYIPVNYRQPNAFLPTNWWFKSHQVQVAGSENEDNHSSESAQITNYRLEILIHSLRAVPIASGVDYQFVEIEVFSEFSGKIFNEEWSLNDVKEFAEKSRHGQHQTVRLTWR